MFTSMQDKYVIVMLCLLLCKTSMLLQCYVYLYARQVCYCNAMFTCMFTCMQDKYVIVMLCLLVCKTSMLL